MLGSVSIVSGNIQSTGQRSLLGLLGLGSSDKGSREEEELPRGDQLQEVEKYDTVQLLVKGSAAIVEVGD